MNILKKYFVGIRIMKLFVGIGLMDRMLMKLDFWKFRKNVRIVKNIISAT